MTLRAATKPAEVMPLTQTLDSSHFSPLPYFLSVESLGDLILHKRIIAESKPDRDRQLQTRTRRLLTESQGAGFLSSVWRPGKGVLGFLGLRLAIVWFQVCRFGHLGRFFGLVKELWVAMTF